MMNGMPAPRLWQEARNADGRVYYYNTQTKATQWTKPEELMTPAERALSNQPWKEYTAQGGRKYWYHTETKQSSWEMPEVYKTALAQSAPPARHPLPPPPAQTFVAGGTSNFAPYAQPRDRDDYGGPDRPPADRPSTYGQHDSVRAPVASHMDPEYSSFEEAESAFVKLLRRAGVQPDWTWEQTMRATIKDPQYRALKDPKDRKSAFERYVVDVKVQEKDRAKERLAKLRADFGTMLRSHPEIKHYTRWRTARPIIEAETIFRSTNDESERRQLFEEYIVELKKAHAEEEVSTRKAAMDELVTILSALNLEPYTRWSEAQGMIQSTERFQQDKKFQTLSNADVLKAFENHIKALERTFNDARQKQKSQKARRERQNRDHFLALLRELQAGGKIKAGMKWKQVHPFVRDDPRYTAMLGQPGSTPLDLFWDVVEEEERTLRGKQYEVTDVLDERGYDITPKRTLADFMSVMKTDRRTATIDPDALTLIFERLRDKAQRRSEEDKHQVERQQRRAVDALRSRVKRLDPPVVVGDTWEQVRPRIEKLEEYRALDSDELRRSAFDKVMRRLKDKEDHNRDRDRSRRDHRERDRDRDRDRDHRNGHHRRHRTRTPEPDAYEADRKKAQADRERQYRKSSTTGLSPPPPHRRERDERDRYVPRGSHYDRERRDREADRERTYSARADPRERASELDYGDGRVGGGGMRRRRDSDDGSPASRRDSKRSRRDRSSRERTFSPHYRSRTPQVPPPTAAPPPKEDPGLRSGSEEGEIEED